jgi:hypothetical protein
MVSYFFLLNTYNNIHIHNLCWIILDTQDGDKLKSFSMKIKENINLFMAFVNSSTKTLIRKLNKISRDYRYVIRTLAVEKKTLKVFNY